MRPCFLLPPVILLSASAAFPAPAAPVPATLVPTPAAPLTPTPAPAAPAVLALNGTVLAPIPASADVPAGPVADLRRDGAFGFPQASARVLVDHSGLRVSAANNEDWLYVQAVVWDDTDASGAVPAQGGTGIRNIGDHSALRLDVDNDGRDTSDVDRDYHLNPWPEKPGLLYTVSKGSGANSGLLTNSHGRGAIRWVSDSASPSLIRAFPAPARLPAGQPVYSHHLPISQFASCPLQRDSGPLNPDLVPEDRAARP